MFSKVSPFSDVQLLLESLSELLPLSLFDQYFEILYPLNLIYFRAFLLNLLHVMHPHGSVPTKQSSLSSLLKILICCSQNRNLFPSSQFNSRSLLSSISFITQALASCPWRVSGLSLLCIRCIRWFKVVQIEPTGKDYQ